MNINSSTLTIPTQTAEVQQNSASSNAQNTSSTDDTKSFKDELGALGAAGGKDDSKTISQKKDSSGKIDKENKTDKTANADNNQAIVAVANQNNQPQAQTDKNQKDTKDNSKDKKSLSSTGKVENPALQPLYELKAKIETINDLKNNSTSKIEKSSDKFFIDKTSDHKTIKMDKSDALFFANLVKNDGMSLQNPASGKVDFAEVKTEATQKNVQVSSVLMDALKDSMDTNKPFRIDFDKDIAVIMKVDRNGKLTAEFIPGDKAVENYLRNNIPMLKQTLDDQNIQYNHLSYRQQQQQKQQRNNNNNQQNKENENE